LCSSILEVSSPIDVKEINDSLSNLLHLLRITLRRWISTGHVPGREKVIQKTVNPNVESKAMDELLVK
jgi:hypothetical protein